MIELLVLVVSALRFTLGIADADGIGASAKVQAANPINKSCFMKCFLLGSRQHCPLSWLPASRLLPLRSGLERDFVLWHKPDLPLPNLNVCC
jgi:hypothetical protein